MRSWITVNNTGENLSWKRNIFFIDKALNMVSICVPPTYLYYSVVSLSKVSYSFVNINGIICIVKINGVLSSPWNNKVVILPEVNTPERLFYCPQNSYAEVS